MRRRTQLLNADYLRWVYDMMGRDKELGLFSIRAGQVFNVLLYKIGDVDLSLKVYRYIARMVSFFKR
jgi:hypothetical protein